MNSLVGLPALTRLALRRDRVMLPGWIAVFVLVTATSASATARLYPTVASRTQAATAINGTPSLVALYGKVYDPASLGAVSLIKLVAFGSALVAVLAIVTVVRHTRGEEEQGRLELVGATVVGRFAALTAALVVTTGACVALGLLSAAALFASGLPAAGSLAFGAAWAGCGIAFAAVAAVAAQLAASARAAVGISCSVLGASYLARAVGDSSGATGPRWLSWLSPIGWAQQVRPYAGNRWPTLLLTMALAVAGIAVARLLAARRDLGAGLLPDRPGPRTGGRLLHSALGLAWRLQRATLYGWSVGFVVLGAVLGNIASNLSPLLNSVQGKEIVRRLGGQQNLTNAFLAAELSIVGLIASAYGVHAVLRLHEEELAGRAELLLAGRLSRTRWMSSHVTLAFLGSAFLLACAGVAAGIANGLHTGHIGTEVFRLLGAALWQLPAVWVLIAGTLAAFSVASRFGLAGWGALVACVLVTVLGEVLDLNHWLVDVSPFTHLPRLPGAPLSIAGPAVLTLIAVVLVAVGAVALRRRDVA